MSDETLPVSVEVLGHHIPAGAVRLDRHRWEMMAARYPEVRVVGFDVVKLRRELARKLEPHVRRAPPPPDRGPRTRRDAL